MYGDAATNIWIFRRTDFRIIWETWAGGRSRGQKPRPEAAHKKAGKGERPCRQKWTIGHQFNGQPRSPTTFT
jgi:hypothetical protein